MIPRRTRAPLHNRNPAFITAALAIPLLPGARTAFTMYPETNIMETAMAMRFPQGAASRRTGGAIA